MSTKTITLSEDAYNRLNALKQGNESFSEVVRRITKGPSLMDLAGILTKEEGKKLEASIHEGRMHSQARWERLKKEFK